MSQPVFNETVNAIEHVAKTLHSNESINKAFNYLANGAVDVINVGKQVLDNVDPMDALKNIYQEEGKWQMGRIAASGLVVGGATRIATGGGLYRDRNGSQDIIGIPFI